MPNTYIDQPVDSLIINQMTQTQYDALPEKSETELYLIDGDETSLFSEQMIVMPAASIEHANKIVQYVGNSTGSYSKGYFYQCVASGSGGGPAATASQTTGSSLSNIVVDAVGFKNELADYADNTVDNTYVFTYNSNNGNWEGDFDGEIWGLDIHAMGITFDGTPVDGDVITVDYIASASSYTWRQVNVQPSSGGGGGSSGNPEEEFPATPVDLGVPAGTWVQQYGYIDFDLGILSDGHYRFFVRGYYNGDLHTNYAWGINFVVENGEVVTEEHEHYNQNESFYYPKPEWVNRFERDDDVGVSTINYQAHPWFAGIVNGRVHLCGGYEHQCSFFGTMPEEPILFVSSVHNIDTDEKFYDVTATISNESGSQKQGYEFFGRGKSNYTVREPEPRTNTIYNTEYFTANKRLLLTVPDINIYPNNNIGFAYSFQSEVRINLRADDGSEFEGTLYWRDNVYAKIRKATGIFESSKFIYNYNQDWRGAIFLQITNESNNDQMVHYLVSTLGNNKKHNYVNFFEYNQDYEYYDLETRNVGAPVTEKMLGIIEQYTGETNANYVNGYFYKATADAVDFPPECYDISTDQSSFTVSIQPSIIIDYMSTHGYSRQEADYYLNNNRSMRIYFDSDTNEIILVYWPDVLGDTQDPDFFRAFSVTNIGGQTGRIDIWISFNYSSEHTEYINPRWEQVNVQPGSSPSYPSTMPTLLANNWSVDQVTGDITQTISNISEVHANSVVIVAPAPLSTENYADSEILCIGQGEGSLTFKCTAVPNNDITVNVICL